MGLLLLFQSGASPGSGSADITLSALTAAGVGGVSVAGAASISLSALTLSALGGVGHLGSADIIFDALTGTGVGMVVVVGLAAITLGALTCVGNESPVSPTPACRIFTVPAEDRVYEVSCV